ncbi:response regulator [Desulfuribacillus alkaliarsenatis]|uniref:DNA-binding response regulator n=1 Tax=Desulfuribacillus alkaliarsenatis TaxID=766136 RepID=A0A1E5G543_9FIRM|nr:response regulator transcription factor [Desulfuribacillus alkaliarsenatis]OEF98300.1 DNA-binding response regulator [Desulfuribacillus alkaliarsenatis]
MTKTTKILLVDDHEIVRLGLKGLLEQEGQYEVVGLAENGKQAVEIYKELRPDLTLMDIRMPIKNGIEACRAIRDIDTNAKVLMLTSHTDEEAMYSSILAGAVGYVKKKIGFDELVRSINQALSGVHILDYDGTQKLIQRMQLESKQKELTDQEHEILNLIGEGMTNREIGEVLCLSEKTVRNYVSNVFSKLNFSNRSQAAVYAVRKNMFDEI